MKSRARERRVEVRAHQRRGIGPVFAMALALIALQFAALSGFDPAASSRGARAGTVNPEGGETAFARQVIRATLAADARALAERADGKPVPGGPLPFILPEMPRGFVSGPARRLAVVPRAMPCPVLPAVLPRSRAPATIA